MCLLISAWHDRGVWTTPNRGALSVIAATTALAGCDTIQDFNPFAGERYKMVVEPVVPASQVYDQGLAKLSNGNPGEAAKKFTDLGRISGLRLGAQRSVDDDLRAISVRRIRRRRRLGDALRKGISEVAGGGLRALSRSLVALRADPRHFARPGSRGQGDGTVQVACADLSEVGICRRRQGQDPGDNGPARRQGNVGRALLPCTGAITLPRSTASATC